MDIEKQQIQPKFIVCVRCATFNQSSYIVDAMNCFTMQETNFPYVCTILDDASTDGEQEVIKKYLQEHFDLDNRPVVRNEETDDYVLTFAQHKTNRNCYFAVLFLKYNHYSIKKAKDQYIKEWLDVKYIALCEGDDYWTHPQKLQMQFKALEAHSDYSMICSRTKRYSLSKQAFISDNACYEQSQIVKAEDVIIKGGLFISTCSIMYKPEVKKNYPRYCRNCHVGDYPLQIMCAMKGNIFYFNEPMAVYRVDNPDSWCERQKETKLSEKRLYGILSEIRMLQGFKYDYPNYASSFSSRIKWFILHNCPNKLIDKNGYQLYCKTFINEIRQFDFNTKIHILLPYYLPSVYRLHIFLKNSFK